MQYRIHILDVTPWGCGFQGEAVIYRIMAPQCGFTIKANGSTSEATFPVNQWVTVELFGRLAKANRHY